jgi:hypothetical protein
MLDPNRAHAILRWQTPEGTRSHRCIDLGSDYDFLAECATLPAGSWLLREALAEYRSLLWRLALRDFSDTAKAFVAGADVWFATSPSAPWLELAELLPLALCPAQHPTDLQAALSTLLHARGRLAVHRGCKPPENKERLSKDDPCWGAAIDPRQLFVLLDSGIPEAASLNRDGAWLAPQIREIETGAKQHGVHCLSEWGGRADLWDAEVLSGLARRDLLLIADHLEDSEAEYRFLAGQSAVVSASSLASRLFGHAATLGTRQLCLSICDSHLLHDAWQGHAAIVSCGCRHQRQLLYQEAAELLTARRAQQILGDSSFHYLSQGRHTFTTTCLLVRSVIRAPRFIPTDRRISSER